MNTVPMHEWTWHGRPGHFCCAFACHWHLVTHIGDRCVSSIGEYWPEGSAGRRSLTSRHDEYYETQVFRLGVGDEPDFEETLDIAYSATHDEADKTHMRLCRKHAELPDDGPDLLAGNRIARLTEELDRLKDVLSTARANLAPAGVVRHPAVCACRACCVVALLDTALHNGGM